MNMLQVVGQMLPYSHCFYKKKYQKISLFSPVLISEKDHLFEVENAQVFIYLLFNICTYVYKVTTSISLFSFFFDCKFKPCHKIGG